MPQERKRLSLGTRVVTTKPNEKLRHEWSEGVWEGRKWGVEGNVVTHHDSHGLSYEVMHPDGSIGHYDPSEIEDISQKTENLTDWSNR